MNDLPGETLFRFRERRDFFEFGSLNNGGQAGNYQPDGRVKGHRTHDASLLVSGVSGY
jgi:hypothetical protein